MKDYRGFKRQVEGIKTENDLKTAHINICRAYSAYGINHEEFTSLRNMMIAKRQEMGFTWGRGI